MAFQFDPDRLKKRIQEALGKIYSEADPILLDKYRKIIKKEVSFFRRSYLTAWLLMEQDQRGRGFSGRKPFGEGPGGRNEREDRGNRSRRAEDGVRKTDPNGYPLADEDSVRLFFSIGRSRRVFPREILGAIVSKTSVSRDDVGAIRILDNYSFVQVRNTVADEIIEALNGKPFRGRTLSVNHAHARKDGADQRSDDQRFADQRSDDSRFADRWSEPSEDSSRNFATDGTSTDGTSDDSADLDSRETFDDEPDNSVSASGDEPSYGEAEDGSYQDGDDRSDEEGV